MGSRIGARVIAEPASETLRECEERIRASAPVGVKDLRVSAILVNGRGAAGARASEELSKCVEKLSEE